MIPRLVFALKPVAGARVRAVLGMGTATDIGIRPQGLVLLCATALAAP
jgi:hypothetical protein